MAGIGREASPDGDGVADPVEGVVLLELQREGRQDELIDVEGTVGELAGAAAHLQGEHAVAQARGQRKGSGCGSEAVRRQLLPRDFVPLAVDQRDVQHFSREGRNLVDQVAAVGDELEAHRVAGVVGAAVAVDVAGGAVVGFLLPPDMHAAPEVHFRAAAHRIPLAGAGEEAVVRAAAAAQERNHVLRQGSEAVDGDPPDDGRVVSLPEHDLGLAERLAGLVIRDVDRSERILAHGHRKGILFIARIGREFAGDRFGGIDAVRQGADRNADRVRQEEALLRVLRGPLAELGVSVGVAQRDVRGCEVAEDDADFLPVHPDGNGFGGQPPEDVLDVGAGVADLLLIPAHRPAVLLEGEAARVEGLPVGFPRLFRLAVALMEFLVQEILARQQGHRGPFVLLRQRFHRCGTVDVRQAPGDVERQQALVRVATADLRRQFAVDLIGLRARGAEVAFRQHIPEDEFPVGADKVRQAPVQQAQPPVERPVPLVEAAPVPQDEVHPLAGRGAAVLGHPQVGHDRLPVGLHLLGELPAGRVPLLPVAAGHAADVRFSGIVEIDAEPLAGRLPLDLREDLGLFLRPVRLAGVFVLLPEGSQDVPVPVCLILCHRRGGKQCRGHRCNGRRHKKEIFSHRSNLSFRPEFLSIIVPTSSTPGASYR